MFLAAESWKPDVCTSCVCMNSLISCFSESCPAVSCERPVLRKGQCCPYCIGKTRPEPLLGLRGAPASAATALPGSAPACGLRCLAAGHTVRGAPSGRKTCSRARPSSRSEASGRPDGAARACPVCRAAWPLPTSPGPAVFLLRPPRRPFVSRGIPHHQPPSRSSTLTA